EASSGFALAVFLALDRARIAGQKPALLQDAAELRLVAGERNGDAVTHSPGLAREPTAADGADDVVLAFALRGDQRLLQDHLQHRTREISGVVLAVDGDLPGSALHPHAGNGVLALAGGIGAALRVDLLLIDTGLGCAGVGLERSKVL